MGTIGTILAVIVECFGCSYEVAVRLHDAAVKNYAVDYLHIYGDDWNYYGMTRLYHKDRTIQDILGWKYQRENDGFIYLFDDYIKYVSHHKDGDEILKIGEFSAMGRELAKIKIEEMSKSDMLDILSIGFTDINLSQLFDKNKWLESMEEAKAELRAWNDKLDKMSETMEDTIEYIHADEAVRKYSDMLHTYEENKMDIVPSFFASVNINKIIG